MSRRNDKEGSGRTTELGHNDTRETVMRPHAKNRGIAANKSHDKAVILFTFPLTGAAKVPLPSPSPIMLISFRRPHVHNGERPEEAQRGRRRERASPTRDQKTYRTIAESYATPRPRAAAFSAAGLERAGRDLGRQILLLSERARASSSFLDSWTEFDIRTQLKKWYEVLVLRILDWCVATYLPPLM